MRRRPSLSALKALRVIRATLFYKVKGVQIDGMPYVLGKLPRVDTSGQIIVGDRFKVDGIQTRVDIGAGPGALLEIGRNVYLNRGVVIYAAKEIKIGDNARVADYASIHDTDFHELEEGAAVQVAPIRIGRNVWIGRRAIITKGVTIGDHAVIGAGAVVTRDVPSRSLVAGVPARVLQSELDASDGWVRR